ncbi:hypothetical protein HBI62_090460 [Parastagonospora nodorum]|nr:hypothetical protein HBI62_090460 [Parastagonospora nodorum]KAH6156759.1 hypothetical protein HBI63_085690 [Parastagonospora nodorum]KAH6180980.1 hypothetical protein HBI61_090770 [Parastagonospora nodorum]
MLLAHRLHGPAVRAIQLGAAAAAPANARSRWPPRMRPPATTTTITLETRITPMAMPLPIARLNIASKLLAQRPHGPAVRVTRSVAVVFVCSRPPNPALELRHDRWLRAFALRPCSLPSCQSDAIEGRGGGRPAPLQCTDRPYRQTKDEGPRHRRITSSVPS